MNPQIAQVINSDTDISVDIKRKILVEKRRLWANTRWDLGFDIKAQQLCNADGSPNEQTLQQYKQAHKMIALIDEVLAELDGVPGQEP